MGMEQQNWSSFKRPYDLRERLLEFACVVTRLAKYLRTRGPIAASLSDQVLRAANSAGANYEEGDDGASSKDTRAKRGITLREFKETIFRLRVLRSEGYLGPEHDPVIDEAIQLKRIVARVIANSRP
jgi:four helix bundle protein